jgi:S-formylglutathione hydrolase
LGTAAIASVAAEQKAAAIVRLQDGYDHSYFFVSTFMPDHIEFHANALLGKIG